MITENNAGKIDNYFIIMMKNDVIIGNDVLQGNDCGKY